MWLGCLNLDLGFVATKGPTIRSTGALSSQSQSPAPIKRYLRGRPLGRFLVSADLLADEVGQVLARHIAREPEKERTEQQERKRQQRQAGRDRMGGRDPSHDHRRERAEAEADG